MKKLLYLLFLPLLLTACGGNSDSEQNKSLSDYSDATAGDSLMFYLGQMRAAEYWREAQSDSTLLTRENRDEFIKGIRAGLAAIREKDSYNQGVYVGMQIAMSIKEFDKEFGVKLDSKYFNDALIDGLKNDSVVDMGQANMAFQEVMRSLSDKKEATDRESARKSLATEAKSLKMTEINKDLYASAPIGKPEGEKIQIGDSIGITVVVQVLNGRIVDERAHHSFVVGKSLPGPITEALLTMQTNENRDFLTTAPALFGRYYNRHGLEATDLLLLKISVNPAGKLPQPTNRF